ncbi:MAG TPA: cobalt transporter CbiM [Armatimonadota bacterium]
MHIPDGYLGPQTYAPAFAVMAAFWAAGNARLKQTLRLKQVPLLALGAAFSFVIMMFNVPIPGGSTGHAIGAVLIAILLGPWAAMLAVSLALIVQALLFGDGGITAIGANCVNMAVICPFAGWGVYRLIAGSAPVQSARHWLGGAVGGYLGLSLAALATGIEFGIQPLLAHDAAGRALYCPFGLSIAVPAMTITHLLAFSLIEGVVTALVIVYLQRTAPAMLPASGVAASQPMSAARRLALGLGLLVLLAPLGLYLPAKFHAGAAWGEWSATEIKAEIARYSGGREAYVPAGMRAAEEHGWHAPFPDYNLPGHATVPLSSLSLSYLLSGVLGVLGIGGLVLLLKRTIAQEEDAGLAAVRDNTATRTRPGGRNLVRRALGSFAHLLAELLANDAIANRPGVLQRIDPRAKVIGLLGLIVVVTLVQRPSTLALAYGGCLALAALSRIPARRVAQVWLAVPLFSAAIMLPALLNVVTPGAALLTLWRFTATHLGPWALPPTLTITDAGLLVAGRFVLRTAVCVTLALLLTTTTRSHQLFRGLRALGVPKLFIMLLSMMERYLTVFVRAAEEIHLAKISRAITMSELRREQAWVAAGMGALFRRTQSLGNSVYLAMVSRGYTGEAYLLDEPRWQFTDAAFLLLAVGVAALLLLLR